MKPIDGRYLAEQARTQYELELSDVRAQALAEMVRSFLEAGKSATRALPMDVEPAQFSHGLEKLALGARS